MIMYRPYDPRYSYGLNDKMGRMHRYPFVNPRDDSRGPDNYPYGFDDYWLWRSEGNFKSWSMDYADRYRLWEGFQRKYEAALAEINKENAGRGNYLSWGKKECDIVVKHVYGLDFIAKGLIRSCNVSSGYDILVFCYIKRESEKVDEVPT